MKAVRCYGREDIRFENDVPEPQLRAGAARERATAGTSLGVLARESACYIDGVWHGGRAESITSVNPSTGEVLAVTAAADTGQVAAALSAARRAFDGGAWSRLTRAERGALLHRLADLIERDRDRLTALIAAEVGTAISTADQQVMGPVGFLHWFADAAVRGPSDGLEQPLPLHHQPVTTSSMLLREPLGVVAAVTAYNYPIMLCAWKLGPALASGSSTVLVPSPKGLLCTIAVVELMEEAGFPPGAVNLVFGSPAVTEQVAGAPEVDMVSFTGSAAVGSKIMVLAAPTLKKVVLELGGKSPNILLPGANVDVTIAPSALRFCLNAGQACGATTRSLVPVDLVEEFVAKSAAYMRGLTVGDASDPATVVGPLITDAHRASVEAYLARAVDAGAKLATGGGRPAGLDRGYFLEPTLITNADNDFEIAQEELFAPVGVVIPYRDIDDAVRIANTSKYALNANIWGAVPEAIAVSRRIRSGTVTINGGGGRRFDAPWGGPGYSGVGRECGEDGYREFFEVKHVQWPL
ncbi:aldehyde dehydrogenase [Nocardia neocaledoniensis NBRC 108232]|uniref:Aldehyde dehydrogenase (NAD+)/betaine-aldehyde dehydrogenase n=1 Tax=Nocardia neocaledoniensis TaxID=236511 RepID=A0A317N124_9NOCA|nr:aldehyde dehydrogenase family protein [Nocardia neocaledoniensis]PWV67576.1 aldehyde dehydrogenase (NAD+)/betaine-aldehyde dehydrogenase [Nocardia neocaledoniensis]GEM31274.1 aldehyde dehydrogenase [Nocardia neocaledoniensis NBRC 108232]